MYTRLVRARRAAEGFSGSLASQEEKNSQYRAVKQLRLEQSLKPNDFDDLGFNLLHWSALCNQEEETRQLLGEEKDVAAVESKGEHRVNVNGRSQRYTQSGHIDGVTDSCAVYNFTPLFICAVHGYTSIAQILLERGADPSIACIRHVDLPTLILPRDSYDHSYTQEYTPYKYAVGRNHYEIAKLLEPKELDRYIEAKKAEIASKGAPRSSICSGIFCSYSRTDELKAAEALKKLLADKDVNQSGLKALAKTCPAVKSGNLGTIYNNALTARPEKGMCLVM